MITSPPRTNIDDPLAWLAARPDIDSVRAAVCDLNGAFRGKRLPVSQARKALEGGMRLPLSVTGVDIWGEDAEGAMTFEQGDGDGLCEWTGRPPLPMTWLARPTVLVPLWLADDDRGPFPGDPRRALAAVIDGYRAEGLTPVVATELEFYLVDPAAARLAAPCSPLTGDRPESDGVLAVDELDHFDRFLDDVYDACAAQRVPLDAAIAENGAGQFEINLVHRADALEAADDAVFFKRIVKGVARKHGFAATFMAKPYGERAGSGMHVHFSLLGADGGNVFDDGSASGSQALRHAVGGLLAAMPESTLLFAPHLNSYRRLRPGMLAPAACGWGLENRTTAIRIPGGAAAARRIEHRVAGADANPYLVLAAILGAAQHGLQQAIEPSAPIPGNAYAEDLPLLPRDWESAIEAFEQGAVMARVFAPVLRRMLVACKRQEVARFASHVTRLELHSYLEAV